MNKLSVVLTLAFLCLVDIHASAQDSVGISLREEAKLSIRNALSFLEKNQQSDGSWSNYPAITALAVTAMLKSPFNLNEMNSMAVLRGLRYILTNQKPDGGIYDDDQKAYNTSICLMALVASKNPLYADAIRRARDFLITLQEDEEEGFTSADKYYGGIGYREGHGSDLSNLQWALQALKESDDYRPTTESSLRKLVYSGTVSAGDGGSGGGPNKELFWDKALVFIQRCQNYRTNDQPWAENDGGFIYSPSESKAGEYTSYGTMTYAGMKSMIYAGLSREDARVTAAMTWLKRNYTLEVNPGMGQQGLFYYYHTLAKALAAYGEDVLIDSAGARHIWRKDILEKLIAVQNGTEGFWVNDNNRWWENNKDLVTSYCVLAACEALDTAAK